MNKIILLGMMGLLLFSCKEEDLSPAPIKLEKKEITVEAQATEVNIKVKPATWRFMAEQAQNSTLFKKV